MVKSSALKECCNDPYKLRSPKDLSQIFTKACSLQKNTYLVIDGPDELNDPDGLLSYLQSFVDAGCRILVTSRDISNIRSKFYTANKMEVQATFEDLKTFLSKLDFEKAISATKSATAVG